ncbi:MAG: hypothetical protein P0S96_02820 [Simkaniaceae bacterium]|nr:hypothetical protein [Candidatus Sacchlamyda saccharinae]
MKRFALGLLLSLTIICQASQSYLTSSPHFTGTIGVQTNVNARFGNQLLTYIKAQWAAEKYNLPYLHEPFDYDDQIFAGSAHPSLEQYKKSHPSVKIQTIIDLEKLGTIDTRQPVIYQVKFNTKLNGNNFYDLHELEEMRNNKPFIKKMRRLLSPVTPIDIVQIPEKMKSIALHVRNGGGYDLPLWSLPYFDEDILEAERAKTYDYSEIADKYLDHARPLKAPPEQYYLDQINKILELYPNEDFYIHIFTDDPDPAGLIERLQTKISPTSQQIIFNARHCGNRHDANVLEDLLSMMQFDILVRPSSSYSIFSHVLGNHELVIFPKKYEWIGRCLVYTDVKYETVERD